MQISVQVNVPDDEFCYGCDLWYRGGSGSCYCLLFDMTELEQKYKENMVSGTDIVKCAQCKDAVQNAKSPQVLADLTGGWKIISDVSIPQPQLIKTLCDADLARSNNAVSTLKRFIPIDDFAGLNHD